MIKLVLPDDRPPEPERTIHFEFRRHKQGEYSLHAKQQAFLVGEQVTGPGPVLSRCYPIKVDGDRQTVEIRRRDFEMLGFTVVMKD